MYGTLPFVATYGMQHRENVLSRVISSSSKSMSMLKKSDALGDKASTLYSILSNYNNDTSQVSSIFMYFINDYNFYASFIYICLK